MDLNFKLIREGDGGFWATCLSHGILAHGTTWGELCAKIWEEISAECLDYPALANICFRPVPAMTLSRPATCWASLDTRSHLPVLAAARPARSRRPKPGR